MRNFVLALALLPAMGQAALVVEGGPQKDASPKLPATVGNTRAVIVPNAQAAIVVAPPIIQPAPTTNSAIKPLQLTQVDLPKQAAMPAQEVVVQPLVQYELHAGQSIQSQLQEWSKRAGWTLTWNSPDDWIVPGDKSFGSDFQTATQHVFEQLGNNGADIRADLYVGNHSIVVNQAGASE